MNHCPHLLLDGNWQCCLCGSFFAQENLKGTANHGYYHPDNWLPVFSRTECPVANWMKDRAQVAIGMMAQEVA